MKLKPLAAAAVAAAALAGCSPAPGTAVIIDGHSYSHADVREMTAACESLLGMAEGELREDFAVQMLVLGAVADEAEQVHGPLGSIDPVLTQMRPGAAQAAEDPDCGPLVTGFARASLMLSLDQPQLVTEATQRTDYVLNPRYGQLELETPGLFGSASKSLRVSS